MYNNGNSSKNVTGASIVDGTVETVDIADDAVTADKLANSVNTDIATGVSGSTTAGDALPKTGGAMTGAITTNSTFDGRDVATDGAALDVLDLAINSTANAAAITIDASENVGIGTPTPGAKLHVENAAAAAELWLQRTGYTAVKLYGSTLGNGNGFKINVGGADRLAIDSSGNVLVGETSNTSTGSEGTVLFSTGVIQSSATSSHCMALRRLTDDGAIVNFVAANNNAVGSISVTGTATAYNTSSDYRLKDNVVPMTGSIDRLKALKPSKFNFISDPLKIVDGFLAHEAGNVVPECASGTKDAMKDEEYEVTPAVMDGETVVTEAVMGTRTVPDYQGIDQSKLVPLLVSALQEAIARIETLENV